MPRLLKLIGTIFSFLAPGRDFKRRDVIPMRILKTNKPIPVSYLKSGQDNGAYDLEKLIWLPGNVRPIRVPDLRLAGMHRSGERDTTIAPPIARKPKTVPNPRPIPNAPGLYVPPGYLAREKAKVQS